MARRDSPYKIMHKMGDNASKVKLPRDMNISTTFTVGDLTPYVEDEDEDIGHLRANPPQGGEFDAE